MAEKRTIRVTQVERWPDRHLMDEMNRPILSYDVMTDEGQLTLVLTVQVAEILRKHPEHLPPDMGRTAGLQQIP